MRGFLCWFATLSAMLVLGAGCDLGKGRFPSCENDDECQSSDASKPYCLNMRCVACAYDQHCGDGKICDTKSRTCADI